MPPTVHDDPDQSRYVIEVDGGDSGAPAGAPAGPAGFTEYHLHDGVIAFLHTEVDPAHQGEGLATTLIRGALDDARRRGLAVQPFCAFVRRFIADDRTYADLVREDEWPRFGLGA